MDLDHHSCYSPSSALFRQAPIGFWQSCFAAFSSLVMRPNPISSHYSKMLPPGVDVSKSCGAFVSPYRFGGGCLPLCIGNEKYKLHGLNNNYYQLLFGKNAKTGSDVDVNASIAKAQNDEVYPRIAIIGGGIAGVTAAQAIAKRSADIPARIVVFEGDTEGGRRNVNFDAQEQPVWLAATARNANSMVPGASMHVMSQRSTLLKIMKDTTREWYSEKVEQFRHWLNKELVNFRVMNINNFDIVPPYFSLHLIRCLGPSASWDERATFVTFLKNFLQTSLLSGEEEANDRGRYILQLARSNRVSFLEAMDMKASDDDLASKSGLGRGFISLHRSHQGALHAAKEGEVFGEKSIILPIEDAIKLEPRISNLPIKPLFAVHRLDDYTANSAVYVRDLVKRVQAMGVDYRCNDDGTIDDIHVIKHSAKKKGGKEDTSVSKPLATSTKLDAGPRFRVKTKDGTVQEFDYVVLAAGVNSPLIARKLSAGDFCPTYPLRGYSLTLYTSHTREKDGNDRLENGMSSNLLNRPISVDDMYCSSVGPNMARLAGFGELVGYRDKAVDVPSLAPQIMSRYARTLFPESNASEKSALQCFRPMSPDDIPIVGEVSKVPGLFLHTGHGTLGWTLCLATSECVAQALCDKIQGIDDRRTYELPGDIKVDRARLSPNRFI